MTETNMRDLGDFTDNELTLRDAKSGGECTFLYRDLETADIVEYRSRAYKKTGGKVKVNITKAQIVMALKVITGFREGFFALKGKAISSDPKSPEFYTEWKLLLKRKAPDLLVVFATAIFEGNAVKGNTADFEPEFVEADDSSLEFEEMPGDEQISGDGSKDGLKEIEGEELPLESSSGN